MLPSEMPGAADGSWKMGSIPGPGGRPQQSTDTYEIDRMRRERDAALAELEAIRGKREPETDDEEAPVYKLLVSHYLGSSMADWRVYEAGDVVEFHDTPNLNMLPMNPAAERRMAAEVEHQESCQREVFAASGAGHGGGLITDLRELIDHAQQEARRVANEMTRHPVATPTDTLANPPPTQAHLAKRGRGRPRKQVRAVDPEDVAA